MSSSGSSGGGFTMPGWLKALKELGQRIQSRGLRGAIVSLVLAPLLGIFIIQPFEYAIAYFELAGVLVSGAFATAQKVVGKALAPVYSAIIGAPGSPGVFDMVYGSVEGALMNAGLAAPFAATLTAVVFAAVLTVTVYVLIRVGLDLVPGLGGLNP